MRYGDRVRLRAIECDDRPTCVGWSDDPAARVVDKALTAEPRAFGKDWRLLIISCFRPEG